MKHSLEKFNKLVDALQELPTIGQKSATRLAYHMVMSDNFTALKIAHAIENALGSLRKCCSCGGMSEDELCFICSDESRDHQLLCIVENAKDILTLEENALFDGRYFVLSALDELDISHLKAMVRPVPPCVLRIGRFIRAVPYSLTALMIRVSILFFLV